MNEALTLLEKAGAALAKMDLANAETLLVRLEEVLRAGRIDASSVPTFQMAVERLAALTEAQRQGLESAINGVIAARETAMSLSIYDTNGRIRVETGDQGRVHKF